VKLLTLVQNYSVYYSRLDLDCSKLDLKITQD